MTTKQTQDEQTNGKAAVRKQSKLERLLPDDVLDKATALIDLELIEYHGVDEPPKGLLESIERQGMLHPPLLVEVKGRKTLLIADGRRRIACADELGWDSVIAQVVKTNKTHAAALTLEANEHRSANPLSELKAIEALMKTGADEQEIARVTGLHVGTVRKRLKLTKLTPALREAWEAGEVRTRVAESASALPEARQKALAKLAEKEGKVRARDVRNVKSVDATATFESMTSQVFDAAQIGWRDETRSIIEQALRALDRAVTSAKGKEKAAVTKTAAELGKIAATL